ncbi:RbsD/FucU family protein [Herbiconiux daphne]|uniref:Fucose isomerase n=1 Tax=Herbiconiux daphne TaxID=2970914 RepID=A0ABT2H4E4_9MICO|nr:RbsD/FucU domain-containing protein [Herbiconiux daphne]MCS5734814.1 fucose isomerase [Herbiconiux daphne]
MLKGIDPLLNGDLLKVLDQMGHGDELVLADRNFPAHSAGRPVIWLGESGVVRAATAILSVFPLDTFVTHPLGRMEIDDDASLENATQQQVLAVAQQANPHVTEFEVIPRFDVYARAKNAFAVVQTLETAPYCVFVLTKGVV